MTKTMLYSDDREQAERLTMMELLSGDVEGARRWAVEYAAHRDARPTPAERDAIRSDAEHGN